MRLINVLLLTLMLTLAACAGVAAPTPIVVPAEPLTITYPRTGTIVYAEVLYAAGEAEITQEVTLHLLNLDEELIAETTFAVSPGAWEVEVLHGYTGEPIEATLRVLDGETVLDEVAILLSNQAERPEGTFAEISEPAPDTPIGGDLLPVRGRASGLQTLTVQLINEAGDVLAEQTVELGNPFLIDAVPWTATLERSAVTGPARIRVLGDDTLLDEVNITVFEAAG